MEYIIRKYSVSFLLFGLTIFILIWQQFLFPDLIPGAIQNSIELAHPEQIGLKPTLQAFLIFYNWSGLVSFIAGVVTAVVNYFRSIGE